MSFDLRTFNKETLGQLDADNAPYDERAHDCVPTAGRTCMEMLGYPPVSPQVITVYEYPQGNSSGESAQSFVDFVQSHPDLYPNPPSITIQPWDITVAEWAGEQGYPIQIFGKVRCGDVRFDPNGTCQHSSVLDAHFGDSTWDIWNSWGGDHQIYQDADLAALNTLVIYHRSVQGDDMSAQAESQVGDLWTMMVQDGDIPAGTGGIGALKIILGQLNAKLDALAQPVADIHAVFGTAPGTTVQELFDHLGAQLGGAATGDPAAAATLARIEAALKQA